MISHADHLKVIAAAKAAKTAHDRAVGVYDAALTRLKTEYGVATPEAAAAKLTALEAEAASAETTYNELYQEFEAAYGDKLA